MNNAARIAAAGLLAYGAWAYWRSQADVPSDATASEDAPPEDTGSDWLATDGVLGTAESAAEFIDSWTGGVMKISAMSRVNFEDLGNTNVQAMLRVIRAGEGTSGDTGYRTLFGGGLFDSFADHPRRAITRTLGGRSITSTAAGAYQFLSSSWDETARLMGLKDFTPRSQDLAALGRIAARGALEDVKAGRFDSAVAKIAKEWASLPGSPYGQPTISWDRARSLYAQAGGDVYTA